MTCKSFALLISAACLSSCTHAATAEREQSSASKVVGYAFYPEQRGYAPDSQRGLKVPDGFAVDVFARDVKDARMMAVGDDGSVYVTRPDEGDVLRLTEGGAPQTVTSQLPGVHGIAIHEGRLYLATTKEVLAADIAPDGTLGDHRFIATDLPDGGQHARRTIGVGPDGSLFVSVGSDCNVCTEPDAEHAAMLRIPPDLSTREVFARGLRNTIGFDWHPATHEMWGFDQGSDWMGNDNPPEELNRLVANGDYGWPFVFGDRQINPYINRPGINKEQMAASAIPPAMMYQAHSAAIAMVFYRGSQFPDAYREDAFVAMHGSWNRNPPTGYKVVRVHFENGQPKSTDDFLTGFLVDGGAAYIGRPAGLAVTKDGALLVSDDANGVIYRVRYGSGARTTND